MRIDRVHTVLLKFIGNYIACDNYDIWLCNSCKKMEYIKAIAVLAVVLAELLSTLLETPRTGEERLFLSLPLSGPLQPSLERLIIARYVVVDSVNCFKRTKEAFGAIRFPWATPNDITQ